MAETKEQEVQNDVESSETPAGAEKAQTGEGLNEEGRSVSKAAFTELAPGAFAVILDSEYDGDHSIDAAAIMVTSTDTTLGNALSVSDEIFLYEADGTHLLDSFLYPFNPGNAVSVERVYLGGALDSEDNWTESTCAAGSSPGTHNCATPGEEADAVSQYYGSLTLTEIMSNPDSESTGEYAEIYNAGVDSIDLLYMIIYDGDAYDTIFGFSDPYDTVLEAGQYAVILDPDYAGEYTIPGDALLLMTDDSTVASGLATNDPVYLYESNGVSYIDGYSYPFDASNGFSVEKVDLTLGDVESNWARSQCPSGSSPGDENCF